MTILTKKHVSRRALLRGAGAVIGLPLLDAMRPALAAPGMMKQARRIGVVYVPNGIIMRDWQVKKLGTGFDFPRILKPLERFREDIVVVSGLSNHAANKAKGGGHAKASGSFLSGALPKYTAGADVHAGTTFDQIAAQKFGPETRVPSLQLGCEDSRMIGNCDTGSSCAYTNTISWKNPDTPMAVEVNPRSVFERLFGTVDPSLDAATRARRALYKKSILDLTRENTQRLVSALGSTDRRKMDEYLTAIREVEVRIAKAENDPEIPTGEKPSGIPFSYREYVKLMFDLQAIAFQSDLTRVSTMMLGREGSVRVYPEIGVPDPHHPLTHHRNNEDFIEKVTKINEHHVELFSYFVERLKSIPDGDGTLLDHSTILYGGAISDGNQHSNHNLPLVMAGRAGGLRGGRHVEAEAKTPAANLFVDILNRSGVEVESFGDSTGRLAI
ncbi:MAG: DUF1552 domain-containing protein [Acidobacteriota bacterium]|jgi:hypothetical protein|nr:DUF1552 domain-containing protein [Bryobacteraceae bacterium CoA2 C42]MCA2966190.1 DUF1552 domain-containing protein [Acidobacteriaceae bacterium]